MQQCEVHSYMHIVSEIHDHACSLSVMMMFEPSGGPVPGSHTLIATARVPLPGANPANEELGAAPKPCGVLNGRVESGRASGVK